VLQLLHVRNPDTDEAAYLRVIERKTAVLFAAATRLGALLAGADEATCDAMHAYGLALGHAFQIADDVLDYAADEAALGKHLGDDLAEGKATLPLIHAMSRADGATRALLRHALEEGDTDAMPEVQAAIAAAGSLAYSLERARDYARAAERALEGLAPNAAIAALRGLARYAVDRDR
jgi:octaprenyl-diphosphate synthase